MKRGTLPLQIVAVVVVAVGIGLAISGGPVIWAVLVILSPPLVLVYLFGASRSRGPNPHFATPPPHEVPRPKPE